MSLPCSRNDNESAETLGGAMADKQDNLLVWVDMEMSGLNPATDVVLEVAVLLTNKDLEIVAATVWTG